MGALIEKLQRDPEEIKNLQGIIPICTSCENLQGIIPICTSCENIRDDKGYWNLKEAYIREHYQAEYTDCICPECAKKFIWNLFNN